jgi:hypothetical protein
MIGPVKLEQIRLDVSDLNVGLVGKSTKMWLRCESKNWKFTGTILGIKNCDMKGGFGHF